MTIAHIASTFRDSTGGSSTTTAAIDTTGADLIVVAIPRYVPGTAPTPSDSKGNSWTPLTLYSDSSYGVRLYYSVPTTVGSGHTFTATGADSFAAIGAVAVSGAHATPFGNENGAVDGTGGNSFQPGSITPPEDDCLVITALAMDDNAGTNVISIDGSYTELTDSGQMGGGMGYWIQTTATATNPTWSWTGTTEFTAATVASFKPAGGGGSGMAGYFIGGGFLGGRCFG